MAKQNQFAITKFRGLDLQTDPFDRDSAFATSAHNVSFSRKLGTVQASYGFSRIAARNPGGGTTPCLGFFSYMKTNGTRVMVARGPRGYYCRPETVSTWTTLLEWGSSTPWAVPHFVPFYDRLWICDGVGIWSWDGNTSALTPYVGSTAAKRQWPPWGCQVITKHFERLWLGGFFVKPGRIWYSNVGATTASTAYNTVAFSTTQFFDVGRQDLDDPITALLPQRGQVSNLLVFKIKSLWTLAGNDAATFDVDMLGRIGCVGSRAATETPAGAFWLDRGHVYRFNGVEAVQSVGAVIADNLYERTRANPGYVWRTFYSDEFSSKAAARHVFQASTNWCAATVGGATVFKLKQAFSTSTNAGIAFSVPCPNHVWFLRFRLPGPSAAQQRIFIRFRAPTNCASTDRRGYVLTYGNYAASSYHGVSLGAKQAVLGYYASASANMVKLASVQVSTAVQTGWLVADVALRDNAIAPYVYTAASGAVSMNAVDTTWYDPRSTMYFGWKITQAQSTASAAMLDRVRFQFAHCNTQSQVGYSPADNTLHVATASTDSSPQGRPLVFDLATGDWTTRGYSVANYGQHVTSTEQGLMVALRGPSANDARMRFFDRTSGYYGQAMSSLWRSDWIAGQQESAQQTLIEAHAQFQRMPGHRMHLFMSGRVSPHSDRGPSDRCSFLMNDSPYRRTPLLPGPFFRFQACVVGSSTSCGFNLSRLHAITRIDNHPSRWEVH